MLILISPAKTLDFKTYPSISNTTEPLFPKQADQIAAVMKKFKPEELAKMMDISQDLAMLNYERYQSWNSEGETVPRKAAVFAYKGDVYQGLDIESLSPEAILFAQNHLRILSGLYGYLRPLDLIKPYRLEMGTSVKVGQSANLYEFWSKRITTAVALDLKALQTDTIINLASQEYSKVLNQKQLKAKFISPQFLDYNDGIPKMISFFAKRARGMMARYICEHKMTDAEGLEAFNNGGYYLDRGRSKENKPVFLR